MSKEKGYALLIHGIICVASAFIIFHPLVMLFVWFVPLIPFNIKITIVVLLGSGQIIWGGYPIIKRKTWNVRWYWLLLLSIALTILILAIMIFVFKKHLI